MIKKNANEFWGIQTWEGQILGIFPSFKVASKTKEEWEKLEHPEIDFKSILIKRYLKFSRNFQDLIAVEGSELITWTDWP